MEIFLQVFNTVPGQRWSPSSWKASCPSTSMSPGYVRAGPRSPQPAPGRPGSWEGHWGCSFQSSLIKLAGSQFIFCISCSASTTSSTWPTFQGSPRLGSGHHHPSLRLTPHIWHRSRSSSCVQSCPSRPPAHSPSQEKLCLAGLLQTVSSPFSFSSTVIFAFCSSFCSS